MKRFNVEVAETREAAERQANALWCDGEVVLDYDDFVEAMFKAIESEAQVLQSL